MKKILAIFCCLCLSVNIAFAFDPYADEEPEVRSKSKLYWGIFMTLVGGFLAYDGFSQEEVDISKPSVDYGGMINYQPIQTSTQTYKLNSGIGTDNKIYNNGNVDLTDVKVYVRYRYGGSGGGSDTPIVDGDYITQREYSGGRRDKYERNGTEVITYDGAYILANGQIENERLSMGCSANWSDTVDYATGASSPPGGLDTEQDKKVYYQEGALEYMDVKVTYDYKHKYKKQNKSDIEGVAGLMIATAGIYFIVDYLVDLHKFNRYMKRNDINIRLANAPNEYKLLFQKRL